MKAVKKGSTDLVLSDPFFLSGRIDTKNLQYTNKTYIMDINLNIE